MKQLSETDKAYIAGLLDGEGCVGIAKQKTRTGKYDYVFQMRVIITNSCADVLYWVQEQTGIGLIYKYKKGYQTNWKPVHRWQVVSNQCRTLLMELYPYLKIKRDIADIVLQMPIIPNVRKRTGRLQGEYDQQFGVYNSAKLKNARGLHV